MNASALHAAGVGPLGFVLVALVATVGALAIHFLMRGRSSRVPAEPARAVEVRPEPIDLPEVREAMLAAAARMGIPERVLPRIASPGGADGEYIDRAGSAYVYSGFERGAKMFEHRTVDLDGLLYLVLRDRAWMQAYLALIGQELAPEEHARRLAEGQEALLARADTRWAERLVREGAFTGTGSPVQGS